MVILVDIIIVWPLRQLWQTPDEDYNQFREWGNPGKLLVQWSLGATLEIKHSNRKMSPSFDQELDKFNFRLEVWTEVAHQYPLFTHAFARIYLLY